MVHTVQVRDIQDQNESAPSGGIEIPLRLSKVSWPCPTRFTPGAAEALFQLLRENPGAVFVVEEV